MAKRGRKPGKKYPCLWCGKLGHLQKTCPEKKAGKPKTYKTKKLTERKSLKKTVKLKEASKNLSRKELRTIGRLLCEIRKLGNKCGMNFLHNHSYRELFAIDAISAERTKGLHGDDFIKNGLAGEEKAMSVKRLKGGKISASSSVAMFDKINDVERARRRDQFDIFVFYQEIAEEESALIVEMHKPKEWKKFLMEKVNEKILEFEEKRQKGKKIGHDAITFVFRDVCPFLSDETCNFYIQNLSSLKSKKISCEAYKQEWKI